jgi:hypothetical protein
MTNTNTKTANHGPKRRAPKSVAPSEPGPTARGDNAAAEPKAPKGKLGVLVELMRRPEGASVDAMSQATGWQIHSVRGAMAGSLKKRGLTIVSEKTEAGRIYRIAPESAA